MTMLTAAACQAKTSSVIYSREKRAHLRRNVERYEWASKRRDAVVKAAEAACAFEDEYLWSLVPGHKTPRGLHVSKEWGCPKCGKVMLQHGNYGWLRNVHQAPWKLTCPNCKEVFPKNDFAAYYRSGLDERGLFDPERADRKLLFNTEHPNPADPLHQYGVDDGFGYKDEQGHVFRFVGFCGYWALWREIISLTNSLADGYLFTEDPRYARKAAILLDRIADVYPELDFDWWADRGFHQYRSIGGKVADNIWENGIAADFIQAYDKVYDGMEQPELVAFLAAKADRFGRQGQKRTVADIRRNIEDGILREIVKEVQAGEVRGNFGMRQQTVAIAAVVLDEEPTSRQWIEWLFQPEANSGLHQPSSGGDIHQVLYGLVDKDGMGGEAAPGYSLIWLNSLRVVANILADYPRPLPPAVNLAALPKFRQMYSAAPQLTCLGRFTPHIGDSGKTGSPGVVGVSTEMALEAFARWNDPAFAQLAWQLNGGKAEGLHGGIFDAEPEAIAARVAAAVQEAGARAPAPVNMNGYGLTVLKSGRGEHERNLWLYFGRNIGHGHRDTLNFGLFSHGMSVVSDLGYPEYTGFWPKRQGWTQNTISHNTVVVDRAKQGPSWVARQRFVHFGQEGLQAVETESPKVYPQCSLYRRTLALIDTSPEHSYVVDIFRVRGGSDHRLSFHAAEGSVTTEGLQLTAQAEGTYAGPEVPFGKYYDGPESSRYMGSGFQYLEKVRRDPAPQGPIAAEWSLVDTWKVAKQRDDVRLRYRLLNPQGEVALATGYPPLNNTNNPRSLEYLVAARTGAEGEELESVFVSVIDTFAGASPVVSARLLPVTLADGQPLPDTVTATAVEIRLTEGRTDLLVSSTNPELPLRVDGRLQFQGRLGMVRLVDGKPVRAELVDGPQLALGEAELRNPQWPLRGTVVEFDRDDRERHRLVVRCERPLPEGEALAGRWIFVENDGERDAAYEIQSVAADAQGQTVDVGSAGFIRGYADPANPEKGFVYDIAPGQPCNVITSVSRTW